MTQAESMPNPGEALEYEPTSEEVSEFNSRIQGVKLRLCHQMPFFGHLLMRVKVYAATSAHRVPTAAVSPDGTCYFNLLFASKLNDSQLMFVLIHETMHVATLTWARQGDRNVVVLSPSMGVPLTLWNVASDYSFNPWIRDAGYEVPPGGAAISDDYIGWSAEQIYDDLLKKAKDNEKNKGGRVVVEGAAGAMSDLRPDLSDSKEGKQAGKGDMSAQKSLADEWKVNVAAARQLHEQSGRGALPGGLRILIDEILDPSVPWEVQLSRWLGENGQQLDYTYRKPGRRSGAVGAYMPSYEKHGFADVILLWDTSGSMGGEEKQILGEFSGICDDLGLTVGVIVCDAPVHSYVEDVSSVYEIIDNQQDIVKGGGGSDFTPAFDLMITEGFSGVCVSFTDGYITVPGTKPEQLRGMLWVLTKGGRKPCDWGYAIKMEG